ncbi:hypothetical protein [Paractinoplanes globisporus]|uniref:Uncharacterized protein n=1 Tax=Paractinoplanes globisporus TaxID=113565 RepID=A0ABW6WV25_9ACTN|nr:hypothetical protein [Actinoplanes globisporus]
MVSGPESYERWRATWVPVERRFLGLDRRTLLPAAVVVALFALAVWLLPYLNDQVKVDDPIVAGDVIQVGPDIQFVPAAGANLRSGIRQGQAGPTGYPDTAVVTFEGIGFEVIADAYSGTPAQLLEQIKKNDEGLRDNGGLRVTSDPVTITNDTGDEGVLARYDGNGSIGAIAAFVLDGTGVEIVVQGPPTVDDILSPAVADMITSVRRVS